MLLACKVPFVFVDSTFLFLLMQHDPLGVHAMKLATAPEMRQLDRTAIEKFHIPGIVLMENAGRSTFNFMINELGPVAGKTAVFPE